MSYSPPSYGQQYPDLPDSNESTINTGKILGMVTSIIGMVAVGPATM